jgi:hypothetical protein
MPLDPSRLTTDLIGEYSRYLRSRFHFRDEQLRQQFAQALAGERRLHAGPFLEVLPAFEHGRSIRALSESGVLHKRFLDLPPRATDLERPLYRHQEEAILKILAGRNVIVATGTGSGKTEIYLLPIINHLFGTLGTPGRPPAVRALLVYPMNALANDQLRRLRALLADIPQLTFGRYTGETPHKAKDGELRFRQMWPNEPRLRNELKSREEMWASPPDILITNFAMLEYLLVRPQEAIFFEPGGVETLKFLVFDEVHTYDGAKGCEIAMLLRRLRHRIGATARGDVRCIGTSATLGGGRDLPDVAKFAEELFDEPFEWGEGAPARDVVQAHRARYIEPERTWCPATTAYEQVAQWTMTERSPARLADISERAGVPKDVVARAITALERTGESAASESVTSAAAEDDWGWGTEPTTGGEQPAVPVALGHALYRLLEGDERLVRLRRACETGAKSLVELCSVFEDGGPRDALDPRLLALVSLASHAVDPDGTGPLLRGRFHFMLRAIEGGFVCFGVHGYEGPHLHRAEAHYVRDTRQVPPHVRGRRMSPLWPRSCRRESRARPGNAP